MVHHHHKATGMKLEREMMLKILIAGLTLPSMIGYILLLSSWHKTVPAPAREGGFLNVFHNAAIVEIQSKLEIAFFQLLELGA